MKRNVRDEGVAGSNPATPTIKSDVYAPFPLPAMAPQQGSHAGGRVPPALGERRGAA
jgi:hypothetical protein